MKNSKASELSRLADKQMNFVSENIRLKAERVGKITANIPVSNISSRIDFLSSEVLEKLKAFSKIAERIDNNPELHFGFISDLEILNLRSAEEFKESLISDLTDKDIQEKEELLNKNLIPYLEELNLESLWLGANQVLESKSNPDRLRHCLISLRTILEYLIDEKLAPMSMLKNSSMFEKEFRKYHLGQKKIGSFKKNMIKREKKIEYFISKVEFGILEEFTKNEIQYVCDCYSILCNVHQPNIGITESQVRILKVKTGITIWLLAYLNKIIED